MQIKPTGNLDEIIDELRCEHRAVEAPKQLEALLRAHAEHRAIRSRLAPERRVWAWGLSFVLVAGLLWVATAWEMHRTHPLAEQQIGSVPRPASTPSPQLQASSSSAPVPTRRSGQTAVGHAHATGNRGETQETFQEGSMDDFVPLPASEGLPPASAISLVRMQIQQNALQQYGLEVPAGAEPRILLAEFAVGEDGLPRAIRIVR
jgi:hypothetical protein